jgi:hypothetical protein
MNIANTTGRTRKAILYFIELSVVAISIVCIAAAIRTFGNPEPPLILREPAIVTSYPVAGTGFNQAHEVHIVRDITYNSNTPVLLTTELINKDEGYTIDLQDTKITAERFGTFKTHKLYFVSHLVDGNWCIKSTIYWTPTLSLRERSMTTKESCYVVNDDNQPSINKNIK